MGKKRIPINVAKIPQRNLTYLTDIEQKTLGLSNIDDDDKADEKKPYIALKYYDLSFECFSAWDNQELRGFSRFVEKLRNVDWNTIYKSAGQLGTKTGFGYTRHKDRSKLPNGGRAIKEVSQEIPVFELRIGEKPRVHGFRMRSVFFLAWLDRNHRIRPM